MSNIQLCA